MALFQAPVQLDEENELTQEEAAERCGVSPGTIWTWAAGRVNPKLSTVIHIASESNISLDVLKKRGERDSCSISTARMSAR